MKFWIVLHSINQEMIMISQGYESYIIALLVQSIFLYFSIREIRGGLKDRREKRGSQFMNTIRVLFAIPIFLVVVGLIILVILSFIFPHHP